MVVVPELIEGPELVVGPGQLWSQNWLWTRAGGARAALGLRPELVVGLCIHEARVAQWCMEPGLLWDQSWL